MECVMCLARDQEWTVFVQRSLYPTLISSVNAFSPRTCKDGVLSGRTRSFEDADAEAPQQANLQGNNYCATYLMQDLTCANDVNADLDQQRFLPSLYIWLPSVGGGPLNWRQASPQGS